ncbi:hypothetical protein GE061_008923 [Apolygus lucorum]|uniref:Uncharacterized protein n=1 Tax=Apolygus lucorum TaxID=248454 RepID=A0A8S9Y012_APOLU|nr:hypothetical protein GE061_008923 [Apolygus lucorum]
MEVTVPEVISRALAEAKQQKEFVNNTPELRNSPAVRSTVSYKNDVDSTHFLFCSYRWRNFQFGKSFEVEELQMLVF